MTTYTIKSSIIFHFTDIHFGIKSDSETRLNIGIQSIEEAINIKNKLKIKTFIFEGDLFDNRSKIDIKTFNIALDCITRLAEDAEVFLIVGNHDTYHKSNIEIHSIKIFNNLPNVHIIDSLSEIVYNNHKILLVPWGQDLSTINNESYDSVCGHFHVSSKYLIASYIEDQNNETIETSNTDNDILAGLLKSNLDTYIENKDEMFNDEDIKDVVLHKTENKSSSYLGNYIDKCKKDGYIFSGHYHTRKEFIVKDRNFIFIGSPFEQTIADIDKQFGFYLQDIQNNKVKFIENKKAPKHKLLKASELQDASLTSPMSLENKIKGNIVKLIIDVKIDYNKQNDINTLIKVCGPLEILSPDYVIPLDNNLVLDIDASNITGKTQKAYLIDYISHLTEDELKNNNLVREDIFKITNTYYNEAQKILDKEDQ